MVVERSNLYKVLVDVARRQGGFTASLMSLSDTTILVKFYDEPHGFAVALTDYAIQQEEDLEPIVEAVLDTSLYIGGWVEGALYIDIVLVVEDKEKAKKIGKLFGQRYIWDFAKMKEEVVV